MQIIFENLDFSNFDTASRDIVLSNKTNTASGKFNFHREVLQQVSSTFEQMIEGDQHAEKIVLADISDKMILFLEYFLYLPPERRRSRCLSSENKSIFFLEYHSVHLLIKKYDVKLMEKLAEEIYDRLVPTLTLSKL